MSTQFKCNYGLILKTFLFQAIQFTQTIHFSISMLLVLFNPLIWPYQVLPLRTRVELEAMAMKGYSAFPKAPALLKPHHHIWTLVIGGGSYPSAEVQSVYSTAPADWATNNLCYKPIPNNTEFLFMEKQNLRKEIFFSKIFPLFIGWPTYIVLFIWNTPKTSNPIYQHLRSGRIWHKVNF